MPEVQPHTDSSAELTQTFLQFVMMQTQQALLAMGKHPGKPAGAPGSPPPNLELGRVFISHLITLRFKTKGNLNKDEELALNNAISHLQDEFVAALQEAAAEGGPA